MLPPMPATKTLLIVYHSMTGGTRQMAEAACAAARAAEPTMVVRLLHAAESHAADVLAADGYLFATPENLAAISGQLKDFFDRCYYGALDQIRNEIVASVERSFRRPKTLPVRTFQEVISPSTQIEPHVSTKPRIVSFRRATDVGASAVESRGRTESGGGGWPGTA